MCAKVKVSQLFSLKRNTRPHGDQCSPNELISCSTQKLAAKPKSRELLPSSLCKTQGVRATERKCCVGADELSPEAQHLIVVVMMDLTALGNALEQQCVIEVAGKPLCASMEISQNDSGAFYG